MKLIFPQVDKGFGDNVKSKLALLTGLDYLQLDDVVVVEKADAVAEDDDEDAPPSDSSSCSLN